LLSDCFGDVPAMKHALEQFQLRGHDVLVVQILAPEELTFPFRREAFFQDLELHRRMQVNPNTVRKAYLKEFQAFMDQLRGVMHDIGVDLMTLSTGDDLGEVLAYHLRRRAAMKNPMRVATRA
jgi:dienelactone hydrolase